MNENLKDFEFTNWCRWTMGLDDLTQDEYDEMIKDMENKENKDDE